MTTDIAFFSVVAVAVAILGLSKGGFAGVGMISTPMVAAISDPITAVGLMLPVMMVQDPVAVFLYRKSFDKSLVLALLPGAAIGVVAAYLLASTVSVRAVEFALGALSLVFALWQLRILRRGVPDVVPLLRFEAFWAWLAGLGSGFSSAIAHAGSPPFQIYVMPKHLRKEVYVGTSVVFFAATNVMKIPSYASLGLFRADLLAISVAYMPLAIASSWMGVWLVRRVSPARFNMLITWILMGIAILLLRRAWIGVGYV